MLFRSNEGKLAAIVPEEEAERALSIMQHSKYGENACRIGTVTDGPKGQLIMRTEIGGERDLDILQGEGLPRIC